MIKWDITVPGKIIYLNNGSFVNISESKIVSPRNGLCQKIFGSPIFLRFYGSVFFLFSVHLNRLDNDLLQQKRELGALLKAE